MIFKNIDKNKVLKLYINDVECAFSGEIEAYEHPTNYSTMTFNDVIAKENNNYPNFLKLGNLSEEFNIGRVYSGDDLIFWGIVNSSGRVDLFPNKIKTKTVELVDFRKWLSITRPVEKLFFNVSPTYIVQTIVAGLNEPKIKVGTLSFSNNENIEAYSSYSKTPYQILKETVAAQTNSLLYFKLEADQTISVNYKSNEDIENQVSINTLDLTDLNALKAYKITAAEFESNADDYSNYVKFESENIISNIPTQNVFNILDETELTTTKTIGKVITTTDSTYMMSSDGKKQKLVIIEEDNYTNGRYYDVLYSKDDTKLEVNEKWLNGNYILYFSYYQKVNLAIELKNDTEIQEVAKRSGTSGEVYLYEKYDDYTAYNDLYREAENALNLNSTIKKIITITTEEPIWEVTDSVKVTTQDSNINGVYLVHSCTANLKIYKNPNGTNNSIFIPSFQYELNSSNNTNNYVNQFDNQSYRTNATSDDVELLNTIDTIQLEENIIFDYSLEVLEQEENSNDLQAGLQAILWKTLDN